MAYDEQQLNRICAILDQKEVQYNLLKMMGGVCIKVDDKMLCGTHIDKKYGDSLLMARVGEEIYESLIEKNEGVLPMDFTGRPMKGYIYVTPEAIKTQNQLEYWLNLCLDYNPLAKKSKK